VAGSSVEDGAGERASEAAAPDTAASWDARAVDWLARAPEVRFREASDDGERDAYYRLRADVILEQGWASPDELAGGREFDAYDKGATHLLGWVDDQLVAGMRIVFPTPGLLLPTEDVFAMRVLPAGRVVNVDRVAVAAQHRSGRDMRLFRAMLGAYWLRIRADGYVTSVGIMSAILVRVYRRLGFEARVLGKSRTYWGETRYPVRLSPGERQGRRWSDGLLPARDRR
jgi:N-acyl-L-homoserine lactone synthetase